ncbi:MAG: molybdate ABC transporter substrate-binding protein [Rhodocyclaceae bacterium]|nr:molybdate ABC transporter substrate-binding protein [Rhodocyclaceae bacterium]MBX3668859.1 molybdate ABC transporter substrate-binding protein [Rhodocyclaceae bacterium]
MKIPRLKIFTLSFALCWALVATAGELTVSAAASLGAPMRQIAALYEQRHPGETLQLNFGASGALLQQIANGAPVDVLATADQETMQQAVQAGLVDAAARVNFIANRLVLVLPAQAAALPKDLADLAGASYQRIALGQPASVPAGRYARAALERAGLWERLAPKLIFAQNVRQALDYVARGEVDAGFVYASDAASAGARVKLALEVPPGSAIVYPAAPVRAGARPREAQRFVEFLRSAPSREVLLRHGFSAL